MLKVPEIFKGNENFWEFNSQYKFIFEDFYNKDKSKDKSKSSKIMWAIYFRIHPKSDFYFIPNKEDLIKTSWLKDSKFKWDNYSKEESLFKSSILTQAERSLHDWNEYMLKRDGYLKSQDYYFDEYKTDDLGDNILSKTGKPILLKGTAKQLDDAWAATAKMYSDYEKIMKQFREEEVKRGKGGKPKSLLEGGEI